MFPEFSPGVFLVFSQCSQSIFWVCSETSLMSVECALSSPVRHIDMKNTDIDKVILEKSISIRHVSKKREPKNPVTVFFWEKICRKTWIPLQDSWCNRLTGEGRYMAGLAFLCFIPPHTFIMLLVNWPVPTLFLQAHTCVVAVPDIPIHFILVLVLAWHD